VLEGVGRRINMKYIRVVCEHMVEDVQLETLRDNQLNVFSFSLPVGIESSMMSNCEVFEVEESGSEEKTKKIGFVRTKLSLDEGKARTELEVSEPILDFLKRIII